MLEKLKFFLSKKDAKQNKPDDAFKQKIEAPNEDDMKYIARLIVRSMAWAKEITGKELDYSLDDLIILQEIIDSGEIAPDQTYELQSLGMALGKIFVQNNENYDWWMVEDEYGRNVCLRYKDTTLLLFPQTMISKRIEDEKDFNVQEFYENLVEDLKVIREENYPTEH